MKKLLLPILIIMLTFTGCNMDGMREPVDPENTEEILVTIPSGATTTSIGEILLDYNLIQSKTVFKMASKELEADGKMKAGDYLLSQSMSTDDIIAKLVDGDVEINTFTFTIPEGFEIRQIVDRLESEGLIDRESFENELANGTFNYDFLEGVTSLEGYLFPDTYEMRVGATEHQIIDRMLQRFDEVFTDAYEARRQELEMSMNDLITLASIIEREAQAKEEFPIVSSVFHNRIDQNMLLQSCATVQYILGERKERLTYDDIAIESPFNTYLNAGLPPAPIASPGKLAIESALYPEETDYLYFVVKKDGNGTHVFSRTLEEHNKAKEENR
ncbi:MAG: endolytic transglycosylase MltG [Clostridia bacterium]|nr:endolytic transglycosylase MltG [Clostridia bacterium]